MINLESLKVGQNVACYLDNNDPILYWFQVIRVISEENQVLLTKLDKETGKPVDFRVLRDPRAIYPMPAIDVFFFPRPKLYSLRKTGRNKWTSDVYK
jgi:hypothetical protein